jgi:transcriptional regulator with XRE-family HTH domain
MGTAGTGGARVAELRKERGITQVALARRAGISLSLLSKIEIGDRTLSPGIAAALARALQISLGALYGEVPVSEEQSVLLEDRACHYNCVSHGWTKIGRRDLHSAGKGTICESGHQHRGS